MEQIKPIEELIKSLKKLPTIGYKTAERLAYAILNLSKEDVTEFIQSLNNTLLIKKCDNCGIYYDDKCPICSDNARDKKTLLVVSNSKDIYAIEKANVYHGIYFALNGTLSPVHNRTTESIFLDKLFDKIENHPEIKEVILALETSLEGELTSSYIAKHLKGRDIKLTRLAYGIPLGVSIEYIDELTISQSIKGRQDVIEDETK